MMQSLIDNLRDEKLHDASDVNHDCIKLYKYLNSEVLVSFIKEGDLRVTFSEDANDPFEFCPSGHLPPMGLWKGEGFISFSACNNIPSLWGNYADKYRGACIEFEIPYLNDQGSNSDDLNVKAQKCYRNSRVISSEGREMKVIGFRTDKLEASKICYSRGDALFKCMYSETRSMRDQEYEEIISKIDVGTDEDEKKSVRSFFRTLLETYDVIATKHDCWSCEEEYRLTVSREYATRGSFSHGQLMFFSNRVTRFASSIILAPLSNLKKDEVKKLISTSSCKLKIKSIKQAKFTRDSYLLSMDDPEEIKLD